MEQGNQERPPAQGSDAPRSIGRLVGLVVGLTVALAAATCGLVAGVPAPDLVLRAVCVGVGFKIVAGWCGAGFARTLMRKPEGGAAAATPRPESDR
jgi:hypothetical protein